jgi:DNA processing protein
MYRWIEPNLTRGDEISRLEGTDLLELESRSYPQWRAALLDERGLPNLQFRWLEEYLRRRDGSYDKLVRHAMDHLESAKSAGAKTILICDPEYPPLLRALKDPPLCLTALGNTELLEYPKISIIGSRNACGRAIEECRKLGRILATGGYAVVSGGAYGCDIAAHKGVLSAAALSAKAIIVFAGGLRSLYPVGNLETFQQIQEKGGLFLSERLWDAPARPIDFPVRNRIVSGLSRETIVMQAAARSGAMVTAHLALEQGRDVSVLTFSEDEKGANGSYQLIEDGAYAFSHAQDWFDRRSII